MKGTMRRFRDSEGSEWEVVAGRESWGSIYAIFIPVVEGELRQSPIQASGYEEATAELERLSEVELQVMLAQSQPKPMG